MDQWSLSLYVLEYKSPLPLEIIFPCYIHFLNRHTLFHEISIFSSNIHIFVKFSVLAWYNCREESFRLDETIDDPFFKSDDVRWCPVIIGFKQHLSLVRFGQWVGPEIIFWIERHIRTILAARMCHQLSQNCHIVLFQMKFSFKSFYKNKLYFPNKNIININSKYHSF